MCLKHTINAGLAAQLGPVSSLEDVDATALLVETSFSFNAHGSTFSLDVVGDSCAQHKVEVKTQEKE